MHKECNIWIDYDDEERTNLMPEETRTLLKILYINIGKLRISEDKFCNLGKLRMSIGLILDDYKKDHYDSEILPETINVKDYI